MTTISGFKFNDINGNRTRDILAGINPDVVFIIDISGSTLDLFGGTFVGDVNGDGSSNRIIDAEIASAIALNNQLATGFSGSRIAIVSFDSNARNLDLNPVSSGLRLRLLMPTQMVFEMSIKHSEL